MEALTRRTAMAMGGASVLAGIGAAAALERGLWPGDGRPRFRTPGTARETIQQRHLPNVPLVTHDGRRVRFYDDLVRDRRVVLTFFSSHALGESYKVTQNPRRAPAAVRATHRPRHVHVHDRAQPRARHARGAAQLGFAERRRTGVDVPLGPPGGRRELRRGLGFTPDDPAEDADPRLAVGMVR